MPGKKLYLYDGPIYNGNTPYTEIKEYVRAYTTKQALALLGLRIHNDYGLKLWLEKGYLKLVK